MRAFFCVELPDDVRAALSDVSRRLRRRLAAAKWVPADNLHVTLRFLGEVGEETAQAVKEGAMEVAAVTQPFALELSTLGAFPHPERGRVLWAGPPGSDGRFEALAALLEEAVQAAGIPPERRSAHPHVTLARFRTPKDVTDVVAPLEGGPLVVPVREIVLMRSELRPQGPIYTPVTHLPIEG